jgi:hypothetical protein
VAGGLLDRESRNRGVASDHMSIRKPTKNNLPNLRNRWIVRPGILRILHRPWLFVVAVSLGPISCAVAQVIPAPFGLQWGEPPAPILSFADRAGSGIQLRPGSSGRETIEVRGPFVNQRYQRLGFTFQGDHLVQVAVYYRAPDDGNAARELLAALRCEIEQSFGPGQLLETGSEKNADGYLENRRVFRWEREGCAIWLISMQVRNAEDLSPPVGEISVVYSNLALSRQIEIDSQVDRKQ